MKLTTLRILEICGAIAALWEIKTLVDNEDGNTISATLRKVGDGQPFVIFMSAMLVCHLFKKRMDAVLLGLAAGFMFWPLVDGEPE